MRYVQNNCANRTAHRRSRVFARAGAATIGLAMISLFAIAAAAHAQAAPMSLVAIGPKRSLPPNLLGASSEPLIEHLLGNPAKLQAMREIAPAVLRFPGGSQANFYDWKTGLLNFPVHWTSSRYMKFWAAAAPKIARAFPHGIHLGDYVPYARTIGAQIILVPNLETSTVSDQAAWFDRLKSEEILPKHIELGNEFYLAMLGDRASMKRWPDEPAAMKVMHEYEEALRPIAGPGAKFAVQSAAGAFWVSPSDRRPFFRRQIQWDRALAPAPWFDAVTLHLYPFVQELESLPGGNTPLGLFHYLMGRCDAGTDRVIDEIAARVPGKNLWITEWNPRGGQPPGFASDPVTPSMIALLTARMTLAFLRHPQVTRSLYFTVNFDTMPAFQAFVPVSGGRYAPLPVTAILGWFNHAANHGGTFQRVVERGGNPIAAGPGTQDRYRAIEGGLFESDAGTTMILENASAAARSYDPTAGGKQPQPNSVEIIATPDLADHSHRAVEIKTATRTGAFVAPPYSVVRISWSAPISLPQ
jgi:hypothetical protein